MGEQTGPANLGSKAMKKLAILCSALAVVACGPSASVEQSGDQSTVTIKTDKGETVLSTNKDSNPALPPRLHHLSGRTGALQRDDEDG